MASFLSPARDVRVDDSSYWYSRLQASRPDLEVANEKLDGRGASALGNAISIDKHLRKITIGPNKISESGAMGLGDGIGRNEGSLTEFSVLDGNDIGPAGCKALITAVKRNRRIVSFS